jgi:CBS domain-containing protein
VKTKIVKDLMVPLSEYVTVPDDATLSDAVAALKAAQTEFDQTKYRHRAILVYDKNKDVVGKISMISILRGLEPKYEDMLSDDEPIHLGFTRGFQRKMIEQLKLWDAPLAHICEKAARLKAKTFMNAPTEGEYVEADATLDEAIHLIVIGHHQSLLVTENKKVVGVLRLTDVYEVVSEAVMACEI